MNKNILKYNLPSFCTSNFDVLTTIIKFAKYHNLPILIESTSNQVNQYGGYSGLRPLQFAKKIKKLAKLLKLKKKSLIIGGDHLGPLPWKKLSAEKAIKKSIVLIKECLEAKYKKIHIDTAIICGNEKKIDRNTTVQRCNEILNFFPKGKFSDVYLVVGSEVPIAGGGNILRSHPTSLESIKKEVNLYNAIFKIEKKFSLVIEPGIGFGNFKTLEARLKNFQKKLNFSKNNNFTYEAHSTDYQKILSLKRLVKNNFKFLKVGPELTYFFSRAVFKMHAIERENYTKNLSNIKNVILREMNINNRHWINYYKGSTKSLVYLKFNSYLDRLRYYWDTKNISNGKKKLFKNINTIDENKIINKKDIIFKKKLDLSNSEFIIFKSLENTLKKYYLACGFKLKK